LRPQLKHLVVKVIRAALASILLCACVAGTAHAELLQRLHVLDFKLTTDAPRPRVGVPFHVTFSIRVRERITQLQYVTLPAFSGLDTLADQRRITAVRGGGSIYRETLTLVARKPGPTAIGSAYLDAVDLRDSKTKRFISNDLILNVAGTAAPAGPATPRVALLAIVALLLLATAVLAVLAALRRRRRFVANTAPTPQSAASPAPAPIGLDEALAQLRMRRDRSSVLRLREALWYSAGAAQGETLDEILQREPARSDGFCRILIAVERAAFIHDARLQPAIDNALSEGEHTIAR
jgi:hypothetical protein